MDSLTGSTAEKQKPSPASEQASSSLMPYEVKGPVQGQVRRAPDGSCLGVAGADNNSVFNWGIAVFQYCVSAVQ